MSLIISLFGYLALFIVICTFVFLFIILISIYHKSYKPNRALVFGLIVIAIFLINGLAIYFSFSKLSKTLDADFKAFGNIENLNF